ncbi:MAG: DNA polymerase III subunit chi [Sphingomonadales bacterium]|jgi:DNA polymerase-3 subunit chi
MQIAFYHLERAPVSEVLPKLLEKALQAGLRVVVRVGSENAVEEIDQLLWTYDPGSFLPHGTDKQDHQDAQPVLITYKGAAVNGAQCVAILDANVPEDLGIFERCLYIFDGRDEAAVNQARAHWKDFQAQGLDVTYWQQGDQGGWQKKA